MKKRMMISLVLAGALTLPFMLHSYGGKKGGGKKGQRIEKMAEELGLSQSKKEKFIAIFQKSRLKPDAAHKEVQKAYHEKFVSGKLKAGDVEVMNTLRLNRIKAYQSNRSSKMLDLQSLLSKEERQKYVELMERKRRSKYH